jgi:hypothetical protein
LLSQSSLIPPSCRKDAIAATSEDCWLGESDAEEFISSLLTEKDDSYDALPLNSVVPKLRCAFSHNSRQVHYF